MADSSERPHVGPYAGESVDSQAGQSWYLAVTWKSYNSFDDFYDAICHAQRTGKAPYWRLVTIQKDGQKDANCPDALFQALTLAYMCLKLCFVFAEPQSLSNMLITSVSPVSQMSSHVSQVSPRVMPVSYRYRTMTFWFIAFLPTLVVIEQMQTVTKMEGIDLPTRKTLSGVVLDN
jgi:hypothetical protein